MTRIRTVSTWVVLLGLGGAQMAFDALGLDGAGRIALATGASPSPRASLGGEDDGPRAAHLLEWTDGQGSPRRLELDRGSFRRVAGPPARRNLYGALLFRGPALRELAPTLLEGVARYALCGERPLLVELAGPVDVAGPVRLVLEPAPDAGALPRVLEVGCP